MKRDCEAKDYSQHVVKRVFARLSLKTRRCSERRDGSAISGEWVPGLGSGCLRDGVEHEWFAGWIAANRRSNAVQAVTIG